MSDIIVWNNARADEIRVRSVKALQGTADEMRRVATDIRRLIPRIQERLDLRQASLDAHNNRISQRNTPETSSERESRRRLETEIENLNRDIQSLTTYYRVLDSAADEIEGKISTTNKYMAYLIAELQRTDGRFSDEANRLKERIVYYTNKKIALRDSFINDNFTSIVTEFSRFQIHNTSIFNTSQAELRAFALAGLEIIAISGQDTFNTLKAAMSGLPINAKTNILSIVIDAPEPYQTMFFTVVPYINISTTRHVDVRIRTNTSGQEYIYNIVTQGGSFRPTAQNPTIYFNVAGDSVNPRGPFTTFFHEVGHLVDWKAAGSNNTSFFLRNHGALSNAISADVRVKLIYVAGLPADLNGIASNDFRLIAINNIMAGNRVEEGTELTRSQEFQLNLQHQMDQILRGVGNNDRTEHNMVIPSRMYSDTTNGAIRGTWIINPNAKTIELFADHFAAGMRNDAMILQNARDFLPNAKEVLLRLVDDIAERVG